MQLCAIAVVAMVGLWMTQCTAQQVTTAIIGDLPSMREEKNETETTEAARRRRRERVELVFPSGWDRYYVGNFTVDPKDVVTLFTIPVPKGDARLPARYNITFTIPDPPEGCLPNTTLWFSPAVYYTKLCMERDWTGRCTLPAEDGFTEEQQLIDNYGRFKRVLFDYEWTTTKRWELRVRTPEEIRHRTRIRKTLKGTFCYDDRDYWLAFSTSCSNTTYIEVEVGIKDMNFVEEWTCRGFDHFMIAQHGTDAFLTSRLFWAIIVPIGYFAFLLSLILGCCRFFQCGAKGTISDILKLNFSFDLGDDDDDSGDEGKHTPRRRKHQE